MSTTFTLYLLGFRIIFPAVLNFRGLWFTGDPRHLLSNSKTLWDNHALSSLLLPVSCMAKIKGKEPFLYYKEAQALSLLFSIPKCFVSGRIPDFSQGHATPPMETGSNRH